MPAPAADHTVPVTLLAGFLGAGKTTLLNRWLVAPEGAGVAVIVNEFGAVGVDGRLVVRREDEVLELANGCLCCELRGDLLAALETLGRRRGLARVVVEASGLASPGPAAQTVALDEGLAARFHLAPIVTVAHAGHIARQVAQHPEALQQLAFAERIVLNHCDGLAAAELDAAEAAVRAVQPLAELRRAVRGAVDVGWLTAPRPSGATLPSGAAPAGHTRGVRASVLRSERPLERHSLELWLRFLTQRRTHQLLRLKGILAVGQGALAVQGVHQLLELVPHPGPPPAISELVVIGLDLDTAELERGWVAAGGRPLTLPSTP